jgi:hypothetical protein
MNLWQVGSAVTYFRRYTLSSILCLQSVDDDANLASVAPKAAKPAITKERFDEALTSNSRWEDLLFLNSKQAFELTDLQTKAMLCVL